MLASFESTLPFPCSASPPLARRVDYSWTLSSVTGSEQTWRLGQTSQDPQPGAQSLTQYGFSYSFCFFGELNILIHVCDEQELQEAGRGYQPSYNVLPQTFNTIPGVSIKHPTVQRFVNPCFMHLFRFHETFLMHVTKKFASDRQNF